MAESYFSLSPDDQGEALEVAASACGRPPYLLEKDVWVVWALSALFGSELGAHLSFKGGTSLSKVYRVIDRFSEDIDLTYDIRRLIPEIAGDSDGVPPNRSQAKKWSDAARKALPGWIEGAVVPVLRAALDSRGIAADLRQEPGDRLFIEYPAHQGGYGYVRPAVMLEFGARSTGEPTVVRDVGCDAAAHVEGVDFPTAAPRVMRIERTFWEKATAAHVFCAQGRLKGERFARHWHDLAALSRHESFALSVADREIARMVAIHKSFFFAETLPGGGQVDYVAAVGGGLRIVPEGEALAALREDYGQMVSAGLFEADPLPFDELMALCAGIQDSANAAA